MVFSWHEDGLDLEAFLISIILEESGTPAEMSHVKLCVEDVGVQELARILECHDVPRACQMLCNGTRKRRVLGPGSNTKCSGRSARAANRLRSPGAPWGGLRVRDNSSANVLLEDPTPNHVKTTLHHIQSVLLVA